MIKSCSRFQLGRYDTIWTGHFRGLIQVEGSGGARSVQANISLGKAPPPDKYVEQSLLTSALKSGRIIYKMLLNLN